MKRKEFKVKQLKINRINTKNVEHQKLECREEEVVSKFVTLGINILTLCDTKQTKRSSVELYLNILRGVKKIEMDREREECLIKIDKLQK